MDPDRAKEILSAWNPSLPPRDEEVREALVLAEESDGLARWWDEEARLDREVRRALSELAPDDSAMEDAIAAMRRIRPASRKEGRIVRLWKSPMTWAAAAALAITLFLVRPFLVGDPPGDLAETAEGFRAQAIAMVESGLGPLDVEDRDIPRLVSWLESRREPVARQLPGLAGELHGLGCRVLEFGNHHVSVLCMADEEGDRWHLFTVARSALESADGDRLVEIFRDLDYPHRAWVEGENYHVLVAENAEKFRF